MDQYVVKNKDKKGNGYPKSKGIGLEQSEETGKIQKSRRIYQKEKTEELQRCK